MSKTLWKIFNQLTTVIAFLLVVVMTVSLLPVIDDNVQAHAQEETEKMNDITGSGTEQDPYVIYTYEGLKEFARIVNGESTIHENKPNVWGELANDIICTDKKWVPIGYYIDYNNHLEYTGHFDGKNHKVIYLSNKDIENVNLKIDQGLFGFIDKSGEVKNIGLENGSYYGAEYVGSVAGENCGTITNCYNTGTFSRTKKYVGGIVGTNYGTIANCYNTGAVLGSNTVGGVVGGNFASDSGIATVTNCYNTGAVSGSDDVGGVVGRNYTYDSGATATVTNCYNTGAVLGSNRVGGVVGDSIDFYSNEKTIVKNCFNTGSVFGDECGGIIGTYDGSNGLIINCYYDKSRSTINNGSGIGLETEDMTGSEAFKENHMIFSYANPQENPWLLKENDANNFFYPHLKGFNTEEKVENGQVEIIQLDADKISVADWPARILSGSTDGGSQDNPYEISDYNTLKQFSDIVNGTNGYTSNTSACAILTNDIICTDKLWVPIGYYNNGSDNALYSGQFDGNNKKIIGLNNTGFNDVNYQGLFGYIGSNGTVKNIGIEGGEIKGADYIGGVAGYNNGTITNSYNAGAISCSGDYSIVGGVVGNNNGTITNCYNAGIINCSGVDAYVGGVVGNNERTIKNCNNAGSVSCVGEYVGGMTGRNTGTITNCYNTGSISSNGELSEVGGVAGENWETIINCYNTGSVSCGGSKSSVGGMVGNNERTITNCYNAGAISGSGDYARVGGVAGHNRDFTGTITNCYNAGIINCSGADAYVGGVAGINGDYGTTLSNCYYDIYMSGNINAIGYGNFDNTVKGLTTLQMTGPDAFSEDCMLFVYDTDNGEKSPWIAKPDIINEETGCVYRYYPHLKGFDYKEVTNDDGSIINFQLDSDEIDTDKWPGKVKATINWSTVSTYEYDKTEHPLSIDSIIFNKPELNTENVNYKRYSVSNSKYITIDAYSNEPGNYCVEIKDDAGNITDVLYYTILNETDYNVIYYVQDSSNGNWNKVQNVINAGTYKAVIEEIPNIENSFTINPKPLGDEDVSLSETEFTFDGSVYTPNVTVLDGTNAVSSNEYTVTITDNINAGTAYVAVKNVENGNYTIDVTKTFNINKKQAGIADSPKAISDLKYNGLEQSLITPGTAEDSCVILYTLGNDATTAPAADDENATDAEKKWRTNIPVGNDAGTYYVWYKVAEDKNHIGTNASCITVTINKADVTVKADAITITYGEAIPTLTAKVSGLADADKDKQNLINYTISRAEGTDVGTYTITPDGDAIQGNYNVKYETGTLTIIKQPAGITENPKTVTGMVYDGKEQKLLTAGTAEDGITIYYALGNDNTTAPAPDADDAAEKAWNTTIPASKDAGTYYVWFKAVADDNHDVSSNEAVCIPVTIGKASVTVKAVDLSKTYGTADEKLSATVTGLAEGDSEDLITYTISRTEGESVGTYTITPSGEAEQGNYTVSFSTGTYTITTSTESVFTITLSKDTFTYDGTEKTPAVTVTVGNTEIPASEYTVTISDNINAGTATVTVSDVAGGNYDVNGTATFNIEKADISPVLSINGWKEGEEAEKPSVTGNTDNGTITYTYKLKDADESAYVATVPTAAGTYTVKAEIAPTKNYNGATVTADFVIEKKAEQEPQHEPEPDPEPEPEPEPEPQPQPVVNTPVNTEPTLPYTTNNTVTNNDGSKTTTDTTYNADYSITKKSVREWKNGKKTTNITLTDKDNKDLINVSQVVETGKSGTKKVTTNIIEANGYHYYNELKTAKSGKQTNITDITNADKSSSYVKMITYPDEKVVRNSIDTTSKGISTIAIGTYATGTSTGTSGSTKKNNTDIATSIGFIGTFNAVGTKVDAKTIESVEKLIANSFEFTDNALSDTDVVETEMIYKATSRNTAKLIKCKTIDSEITVPSKVVINGKSYKVYAVAKNAFNGCNSLTKVTLGKTITTIGVKAFADLESLSEIVFNSKSKDGIKIEKGAFNGISEEAKFYMKASKAARDKTANRIKKSGYGNDVVILKK